MPIILLCVAVIVLGAQQARSPVGWGVLALGVVALVWAALPFVRMHG